MPKQRIHSLTWLNDSRVIQAQGDSDSGCYWHSHAPSHNGFHGNPDPTDHNHIHDYAKLRAF